MPDEMASVYKTLSKSKGGKPDAEDDGATNGANNGVKRNKQRVLILSSRGVTYRWDAPMMRRSNSCADPWSLQAPTLA